MKRLSGTLLGLLAMSLTLASAAVAAPFAYVANFGSGNVSVVDGATNAVVTTVTVGSMPLGVAVNPAGTRAYVANAGDDSVSVIDAVNNTVVATIPGVGSMPSGVVVSADGTRVYVANGDGTIAMIDAGSNSLLTRIATGGALGGVATAGSFVYVTDFISGGVLVVDVNTSTITPISVSASLFGVAVNPAGTRLYVPNGNLDVDLEVAVIDLATNTVVASVPVGGPGNDSGALPAGVALNPSGSRVYVAISRENSVVVIDTTNNTVVATVPVGTSPFGVAVDPTGLRVFVGNSGSSPGTVSVIDTATNIAGAPVAVGGSPLGFGSFVAGAQPSPPPPPPLSSCEDEIKVLQQKVGELKHWWHSHLKIAFRVRGAALREIELASAKVGEADRRIVHARKESANGDKALCAGRYWRAEHEFSEAYVIAHSVLRPYRRR